MPNESISEFFDEFFNVRGAEFREIDNILDVANSLIVSILDLSSDEIAALPEQIRDLAITLKNYVEDEKDDYEEKDKGKYCINCGEYLCSKARYCSRCGIPQE